MFALFDEKPDINSQLLSARRTGGTPATLCQLLQSGAYHASFDNLASPDVLYGRRLEQRELIKQNTLVMSRQMHYDRQQANQTT